MKPLVSRGAEHTATDRLVQDFHSRSERILETIDIPSDLPAGLKSSYRLVRRAFPEGIPDDVRIPLMRLLYPGMGHRTLAALIGYVRGTHYLDFYHDVLVVGRTLSLEEHGQPMDDEERERVERVSRRLMECGYEQWLAEED